MAFCIDITKVTEDDNSATYSYTGAPGHRGLLRIHKQTGEIEMLETSPGDEEGNFYARASAKLRKHWRAGRFPDKALWAS